MESRSEGFPYREFRRGQREVAEAVARAVSEGSMLVIKAPTGYGKTAAVIYGLLRSGAEKVLYVVRTVNEIDPVVRELKAFGASFTFLFSAKRMCPLLVYGNSRAPTSEDFWASCRIARSRGVCRYYDNLRLKSLDSIGEYVRSHVSRHAYRIAWDLAKHLDVCPFFALKGLIDSSTFIIATYPYLFRRDIFEVMLDPYDYEDLVIVVDEAHSLMNVHRLLEQSVTGRDVEAAIREAERYMPGATLVVESLKSLLGYITSIRASRLELLDKKRLLELIGDYELIIDAAEEVRIRMAEEALHLSPSSGIVIRGSSISRVASWISVLSMDESFLFAEPREGHVTLIATPLDPGVIVRHPLSRAKAVILMSGTLPPDDFVGEFLGVERQRTYLDVSMLYGPVYTGYNYYSIVASDVTTLYRARTRDMYARIAEYVSTITSTLPGLKMAVYPSYEVMEKVVPLLGVDDMIIENRSTSLDEVMDAIVAVEKGLINAVAGGKLVEGVEFTDYEGNNMLTTVILVGVPFPQPDTYTLKQLEVLSQRLGSKKARRYTYLISAVIRARQALGRAIRGPGDRAVYVFLDYRYLRRDIRELLNVRYDAVFSGKKQLEGLLARALKFINGS